MRRDGNVSVTLSSQSAGDSLDLTAGDHVAGFGATLIEGSTGFLGIPRSVRFQEGAGDGGRLINSRAKTRPLLLKLAIWGDLDRQRETLSRLRAIVTAGDCEVQAVVGSSRWRLNTVYESGLEGELSAGVENHRFTLVDLALTAPQPWWEGARNVSTLTVRDETVAFLSDLAGLHVASGSAIGEHTVRSQTDAPTPIDVRITGPAATASVTVNGRGFSLGKALTAGQVLTVTQPDGRMPQVTLDGVSSWGALAPAPRFPSVNPGDNRIVTTLTGGVKGTVAASDLILATNLVTDPALRKSAAAVTVDDATAWTVATGTSHGTASCTMAATDAQHPRCAWWTVAKPSNGWAQQTLTASIGGINTLTDGTDSCTPTGGALVVEQLDADGGLLMTGQADQAGTRTSLAFDVQDGCETIRIGWYGSQPQNVGFAALLAITPKPAIVDEVIEDANDPLGKDPGYFDGGTLYASWLGTANASQSVLHGTEETGGTKVTLSWRPRREQVR